MDLQKFELVKKTQFTHHLGELGTLNNELIAVGGTSTRYVDILKTHIIKYNVIFRSLEVLNEDKNWIKKSNVGGKDNQGSLHTFNLLTLPGKNGDYLLIFGSYLVFKSKRRKTSVR